MKNTDINNPDYFHKIIDCQWACPAHTPVPEYIRLIAEGRYTDAYRINRASNVFPGILGRVCDRPCEPACRRERVDGEAVAICRLKRAAADFRDDIEDEILSERGPKNGKTVCIIGAGPAGLTVAEDLLIAGYNVEIYDKSKLAGGAMRTQVPAFRLPEKVLNEEVHYILGKGAVFHSEEGVEDITVLLNNPLYDAVVVATGAPQGKDLSIPGREEADARVHIAFNWLESIAFGHTTAVGKRVLVIGGGNTAMDCARSAKRLGAQSVKLFAPETYEQMLASPWEKEDAEHESIQFHNLWLPDKFLVEKNKIKLRFSPLERCYDESGKWSPIIDKSRDPHIESFDEVILAIGQQVSYPFIKDRSLIQFNERGMPVVNETTFQSTCEKVFFVGDAAFGPKNIITAVAQGHETAISIHKFLLGEDINQRPERGVTLNSEKLGYKQWGYNVKYSDDHRHKVPEVSLERRFHSLKKEVEKGFSVELAYEETQRCLNCDVQTVFFESSCIECDACIDVCPLSCLTIIDKTKLDKAVTEQAGSIEALLSAPRQNVQLPLFAERIEESQSLMVKDEDLCIHCGLCAERCPTGAWDMQKATISIPKVYDER